MAESAFTCSFPGCDRHPSKGDDILRISAKGGPFVGRCREHYGAVVPSDLNRSLSYAKRPDVQRAALAEQEAGER